MSAKWRRVQRWDAEHLTGWLLPARWVLHTLSSIWFAVMLLVLIGLYGVLASIPIGLLATIPTAVVVGVVAAACGLAGGAVLGLLGRRVVPTSRPGLRFAVSLLAALAGLAGGFAAWWTLAWPAMRYDEATGEGFRMFAGFIAEHEGTTLRRLPGVEMTELEFYSWWPMRLVLVLFVINLAVATIRRIEFTFKNIGVLTVHTGIITIALGSVYYQGLKKEGDALLRAGMPDEAGKPGVGPPVRGFYDNTAVALWVAQRTGPSGVPLWESRRLRGVPRYNDYGLDVRPPEAAGAVTIGPAERLWSDPSRPLSLRVPGGGIDPVLGMPRVDPDISFRVVGYAEYADPVESLLVVDDAGAIPGERRSPVRIVDLISRLEEEGGRPTEPGTPAFTFRLRPGLPAGRVSENQAIGVEYTIGMDQTRLADLTTTLPEGVPYGLVVEIPAAASEDGLVPRAVVPARAGLRHAIGETGWSVGVRQVHPSPPFPIITPGYEGASSSVVIVEITPPGGEAFERWVYHRFPEISQDLLSADGTGRPTRRAADPAIRIGVVDASRLQVYFNERAGGDDAGTIDAVIREPAGGARVVRGVEVGQVIADVVEQIDFRVSARHAHAQPFEHPMPVPEADRDGRLEGTHSRSLLAVEVSADVAGARGGRWSTVIWVPYLQYLGIDPQAQRSLALPDGRTLALQFGRVFHAFPGFSVQLLDFEMIAYDHRGAPRDYQSRVVVSPDGGGPAFEAYEHVTRLNAPLTAPFIWSESRGLLANIGLRLTSGLNPSQFKLSQSGWDQDGWTQTQQLADAGQVPRPFARYTILQVGNNPGIHVIALGGVMMAVGIPWAFYIKPWLVRRESRRLAEAARAGRDRHGSVVEPAEAAGQPVGQA